MSRTDLSHPYLRPLAFRRAVWLSFLAVLSALAAPAAALSMDMRSGKLGGVCNVETSKGAAFNAASSPAQGDAQELSFSRCSCNRRLHHRTPTRSVDREKARTPIRHSSDRLPDRIRDIVKLQIQKNRGFHRLQSCKNFTSSSQVELQANLERTHTTLQTTRPLQSLFRGVDIQGKDQLIRSHLFHLIEIGAP